MYEFIHNDIHINCDITTWKMVIDPENTSNTDDVTNIGVVLDAPSKSIAIKANKVF